MQPLFIIYFIPLSCSWDEVVVWKVCKTILSVTSPAVVNNVMIQSFLSNRSVIDFAWRQVRSPTSCKVKSPTFAILDDIDHV